MSPKNYKMARSNSNQNGHVSQDSMDSVVVDGRPYLPNLKVEADCDKSVASVAATVVGYDINLCGGVIGRNEDKDEDGFLRVRVVTGGITNALFRVSGFVSCQTAVNDGAGGISNVHFDSAVDDSVLVRVFGAEGMIDRDFETSAYAALCDSGIAHRYLGRFGNGRVEGWLDGYRPLETSELSDPAVSRHIAQQLAHLHERFDLPSDLNEIVGTEPGMWGQLFSWMAQSKNDEEFPYKVSTDKERGVGLFDLFEIEKELIQLKEGMLVPADALVAYCHNDILAANVMRTNGGVEDDNELKIQLIDFEYGGYNYASFDIANHFNEWAGGTDDAKPDYSLFPSSAQMELFVRAYLGEIKMCRIEAAVARNVDKSKHSWDEQDEENDSKVMLDQDVQQLLLEVEVFVMANHLYWGLWGVNQAKAEGCDGFDYLLYAKNRFNRFKECKKLFNEKTERRD